MKYIPILFNTEMVQAILDGKKTQTRRIAKYSAQRVYDFACADGKWYKNYDPKNPPRHLIEWYLRMGTVGPCMIGDVLWVRETFDDIELGKPWYYKADGDLRPECWKGEKRHPSIHMPREAARIFLRVTDVHVEHLCDMRLNDCLNEGVRLTTAEEKDLVLGPVRARERFSQVWNSTIKPADIGKFGWEANPWVWVITFERCDKPEGW